MAKALASSSRFHGHQEPDHSVFWIRGAHGQRAIFDLLPWLDAPQPHAHGVRRGARGKLMEGATLLVGRKEDEKDVSITILPAAQAEEKKEKVTVPAQEPKDKSESEEAES
jgi:hypothetical protein